MTTSSKEEQLVSLTVILKYLSVVDVTFGGDPATDPGSRFHLSNHRGMEIYQHFSYSHRPISTIYNT